MLLFSIKENNNFMMNKNSGKLFEDDVKTDLNYFNFIRRNQQIVREFKVISKLEKKSLNLKKGRQDINYNSNDKITAQNYRYGDQIISMTQVTKQFSATDNREGYSLKTLEKSIPNQNDSPMIKRRSRGDNFISRLIQKQSLEIKTRNLSIPTYFDSLKDNNQFGQKQENVKFPKISTYRFANDQQLSSDSSLSIQKEIVSRKIKRKKQHIDSKKLNYSPLMLDNTKDQKNQISRTHCKTKSMKLTDIPKAKLNGKLIRTYYDYQNYVQLKDKVTELMPTFKPLLPRKKDKIQILQVQKHRGQLQKYIQTNKIERYNQSPTKIQKIPSMKLDSEQQEVLSNISSKMDLEKRPGRDLDKRPNLVKHSSSSPIKQKKVKNQINLLNNNQETTVYHNKIVSYREFLFLINFAHRVFDPLILKDNPDAMKNDNKYKYYLGKGNNGLLVKSLMKRRFWWVQTDDIKEANFVWTQLKIGNYYQFQKPGKIANKFDKLDEDHPFKAPKQKKIIKNIDNKKPQQKAQGGILRGILPEKQNKIFTNADKSFFQAMLQGPQKQETLRKFQNRLKYLPQQFLMRRELGSYKQTRVHNHFLNNYEIGNKKALFYHLKHYYDLIDENPFDKIPLTFHIKNGINDPQYQRFTKQYKKIRSDYLQAEKSNISTKKMSKNVWIIKPGELSNRGNGITVIDQLYQLNSILKSTKKHTNGQEKTYIVQKYIEKPMLYRNRKFDIRHYMMISRLHGRLRAYWFSEGYIRTSSFQYDLEEVGDVMVHLTNDAIQKNCASYGRYQEGNKLSYSEFQRYLDGAYPEKKYSFLDSIYPKMREIANDAVKATYLWMDPQSLEHNFEIFGLDFMIDMNFKVWLIEVNSNPCLELSSVLLNRVIPTMVEHSLRLALDPIFPPTAQYSNNIKYLAPDSPLQRLQFQLIFDEGRDGKVIQELLLKVGRADCGDIQEQDETYENDGKQIDIGGDLE